MEWYGCKVFIGCTQFILVPILISVERQSMQLLASPEKGSYTLRQINQDSMIFVDSPSILNRFPSNFAKVIFYSNPNSPENFIKLYSVFQKLDHLTCSKLKLRRPSISRSRLPH